MKFLKLLTASLACLTISAHDAPAQQAENKPVRPNVIIFLADDLGYGDLASYGHPIIQTPNLDRFAGEGVRMLDMHSAGTVCSPSRAGLLTGRNPYRSGYYNIAGFFGTTFGKDEITVAQLVKEAGYETAFFGKWHLSKLEADAEVGVNEMGFDYSFATTVNAFDGPRNPGKFIRNGRPVGPVDGWYADIIVREASDWLSQKRDPDKPFFLVIASHETHTPVSPPKEFMRHYEQANIQELTAGVQHGGIPRPPHDLSEYKKEYYGTVTQLDNAFGNLLKSLAAHGLEKNTLVVFTSDNGPEYPVTDAESGGKWTDSIRDKALGTPGILRGMKRYPYEGGHRVPGLARWPGNIPAGIVSDKLFNGTDFLPTICQLAGVSLPNDRIIDGTNAFNAFLGKDYDRDLPPMWFFPVNYEHMPGMAHMAMRYNDYVLIGHLSPERNVFGKGRAVDWIKTALPVTFELYNVRNDLAQKSELTDVEPDVLMKLVPMMQRRWMDIRDDGPWWGRTH